MVWIATSALTAGPPRNDGLNGITIEAPVSGGFTQARPPIICTLNRGYFVKKRIFGVLLLLLFPALLPLACKSGGNSLSSPSGPPGPTSTFTPTFTPSPTPTFTPTPNCTTVPDISAAINSLSNGGITDISGDDATDTPGLYLDGLGSTGNIFSFHVSSAVTLSFSLCPTENPPESDRDMILAIRSGYCGTRTDIAFNDDACDLLPEIQGFQAAPGVDYYVVPMDYGQGVSYDLRILSGPVPGLVCTMTPVSTPQAVPQGQQPDCTTAYPLGTLGTGDSVATGHLDDEVNTDDYYSLVPTNSGTVTVSLDCYDNGLNQADFQIFGYQSPCGSPETLISNGSSSTTPGATFQQFNFPATAGVTYIIDVDAYFGGGPYRLTLQTP
jgi:hypothetical protein